MKTVRTRVRRKHTIKTNSRQEPHFLAIYLPKKLYQEASSALCRIGVPLEEFIVNAMAWKLFKAGIISREDMEGYRDWKGVTA